MKMEKTTHLKISNYLAIPLAEIEMQAIRAQGSGGQNVNKVSTAIHLRFKASSLPEHYKERLCQLKDSRITSEGVIIIKAQRFSSQPKNWEDALKRLGEIIKLVTVTMKTRLPTKPTKTSQIKRLEVKSMQGQKKSLRSKIDEE